jgi:hypothetical protein
VSSEDKRLAADEREQRLQQEALEDEKRDHEAVLRADATTKRRFGQKVISEDDKLQALETNRQRLKREAEEEARLDREAAAKAAATTKRRFNQ